MLTATASWPTSNARLVFFVLRGVCISLAAFGLLRLGWIEAHVVLPFTLAQAALAVRLFGVPALPIDVTLACSGVDAISLSVGAIAAYPAPWRRRVTGAAGAIGLIVAMNVLRIGTLGRAAGSRVWFDALHLYVWPAAITLAIAAYVLIWMRRPNPIRRTETTRVDNSLRLSRRFVVLAGIFLLAFIAAAPFYLNNAVVLSVASFVARSAAAILSLMGVHAFAAGNVLWGARGGFTVTEECISTPLIPIYLAGVIAYAPNWKRLSLGLAAAVPLFVALGVVRLLVVALPESVESQSFFIHAFYQLFAGVLIVFAAAVWRHRDRTAAAWGAAGVGAGTLFIVIAGPLYLRMIAAVSGLPSADPQGAIAFLPAFQAGLYLALWMAAFAKAGWRRAAAGFVMLASSQFAGLVALNALLNHTSMTMAVRDVRGWALAAPVLAIAAVVSIGRPRR